MECFLRCLATVVQLFRSKDNKNPQKIRLELYCTIRKGISLKRDRLLEPVTRTERVSQNWNWGMLKRRRPRGLWCRKLGQLNFHHVTEKRLRTSLMHKQRTIPSPSLLYSCSQGSLSLTKSQSKSSYPILIPQWPDNQHVSLIRLIHLTWGDWTKTLPCPVENKIR